MVTRLAAMAASFLAVSAIPSNSVERRSFSEVRARVYAEPLATLPLYDAVDVVGVARMAANLGGGVAERAFGLFAHRTDFRPRAPKFTHAAGVCADAEWMVRQGSGTGLFASGARVPAIVRLATAGNDPDQAARPRSWSVSLKLFPAPSPETSALSVNVVTADQFGINGVVRKSLLYGERRDGPVRYSNTITGTGGVARLLNTAFEKVDTQPGMRPLYPLSTVAPDGTPVASPRTPRLMQLVARVPARAVPTDDDFRKELLQFGPGEIVFDIVLPPQELFPNGENLGTLTLGKPVVSVACDEELSFYHHPNDPSREAR